MSPEERGRVTEGGRHVFETPEPISVTVEIPVGAIQVTASDRLDTIVEVLPSRADRQADLAAAERVRVDRTGDLVAIKSPRRWTEHLTGWGERGSVEVRVVLPLDSQVRVDAGVAAIVCAGRLGDCELATVGDIHLEESARLRLHTGAGDLSAEKVGGRLEAKTGSGSVRIGSVEGPATVRNSNGETWIGQVAGDLEVRAANGRITVDRADAGVDARTANGDVVIGEVARGAVFARTAMGRIEVGVRDGVAAWLEVHTHFGNVHNDLAGGGPPQPGEESVEVHASTSFGDITVRRLRAKEG